MFELNWTFEQVQWPTFGTPPTTQAIKTTQRVFLKVVQGEKFGKPYNLNSAKAKLLSHPCALLNSLSTSIFSPPCIGFCMSRNTNDCALSNNLAKFVKHETGTDPTGGKLIMEISEDRSEKVKVQPWDWKFWQVKCTALSCGIHICNIENRELRMRHFLRWSSARKVFIY